MNEADLRITLGNRIRLLRRAADLTQAQLGKKVAIPSVSHICEIEKGRRFPSIYLLHLLETELGYIWPAGGGK